MASQFGRIFKAYDVRGVYPDEFDDDGAYRIGAAFASWVHADRVVLGRDCRLSSPALSDAFCAGVTRSGASIVDLGLATTDMVYFASGRLGLPGAMFTASHNPPSYNGIKLCRERAAPISEDTGLREIRDLADSYSSGLPSPAPSRGSVAEIDFLDRYLEHLLSFADL